MSMSLNRLAQLENLSRAVCFRSKLSRSDFFVRKRNIFSGTFALHKQYVQGNMPKPGLREYFYYIDHQGQLFLDDTKIRNFVTCFKDKDFLLFFFKRLRLNATGPYKEDFPYISPCGKEMNYIRCDDKPVVFTHLLEPDFPEGKTGYHLVYNNVGPKLTYPFDPTKLCMLPRSGRVYHVAPEKVGGVGLIKSSLAIELSSHFKYKEGAAELDPPTHFEWNGSSFVLDNLVKTLINGTETEDGL